MPLAGASPWRPAGVRVSPRWMRPLRNVPVVSTTAPRRISRPSSSFSPLTRPDSTSRSSTAPSMTLEAGGGADRGLHGLPVELAVGLGAGALDGGALGAVEQAELDAGSVGDAAHEAVEGVDLADQVAFAEAANGRVARHFADGGKPVGDEGRAGAHARCRAGGFDTRVAAAHDDDVVGVLGQRHGLDRAHERSSSRKSGEEKRSCRANRFQNREESVSRETRRRISPTGPAISYRSVSRESSVKLTGIWRASCVDRLFADAEAAKNLAKNFLDVDATGEAAQRVGGAAQILGAQLGFVRVFLEKNAQLVMGIGHEGALAGVGQRRRLAAVLEAVFGNRG